MTENTPLGSGYVLQRKIGSGAMGSVWLAHDRDGKEVACKLLRSEFADDPAVVAKFVGERTVLVRVRHPHVVAMHDLVVDGGRLGIVMDLVRGSDLRAGLRPVGTLPPAEVARFGAGVAAGLAAVHAQGIVHRDVKPENILIDTTVAPPQPRVSDFGLARIAESSAATRSSMAIGTPNYMAPELADGHIATPAADVYSLGIVLYEMACGVTPFEGGTQLATIRRHGDALPGRPGGIPEPLWEVITDCTAKDPGQRPTASALAERLSSLVPTLASEPAAPRLAVPPAPVELRLTTPHTAVLPTAAVAAAASGNAASAGLQADHPVAATPQPIPVVKRKRRVIPAVAGVLALALLAGGGYVAWSQGLFGGSDTVAATPTSSTDAPAEGTASPDASASASPPASSSASPSATPTPSADATAMPDVVGMSLSQTRSLFPGVKVETELVYDEEKADNTVIAQDPAAGQPIGGSVKLTVARRPVTVYLADLESADSDNFSACNSSVDAVAYPKSMCMDEYWGGESGTVSWNLSKGYRKLQATVGRSDDTSNTETKVKVEVSLDQRVVWSETVEFGTPVQMDIDVTDALRLKIEATALNEERSSLVLGDIRVLGLPGEVPEQKE